MSVVSAAASQGSDAQSEAARVKAEIASLKAELQCTECEDDQAALEDEIKEMQARLQRLQAEANSSSESNEVTGAEAANNDNALLKNDDDSRANPLEASMRSGHKPEPGEPGYLIDIVA